MIETTSQETTKDPAEASADAVHKQKNAAQAVEIAREAQITKAIEDVAKRTKSDMIEGLRDVFGDSDTKDPEKMKVIVRRVPILCVNVENTQKDIAGINKRIENVPQMHTDILEIKDNLKWGVRIVLGAIILAVLAMLFKGG